MDFPFADAAGIIRANQKDLYVENDLYNRIRDAVQGIKGVRFTHSWSLEIQALATLAYLGLTSLAGSRTLGEEYTDVFLMTPKRQIPSKLRVGLYVLTSGLTPLLVPKLTVKLRELVKNFLKKRAQRNTESGAVEKSTTEFDDEFDEDDDDDEEEVGFFEEHFTPATLVSLNLMIFYFSGAYYQLSKRIFGLRYSYGHRVDPLSQPSGSYELIGILMIVKTLFKTVAEVQKHLKQPEEREEHKQSPSEMGVSLEDPKVMPFIEGESRRCNLCLEYMRAPTVTMCGHMFCWTCIAGWCRDQSECPLCRQECHEQHLLCLRS